MQLSRFPRVRLAHLPTPLEPLDRLHDLLGGPRIWIKRDDCTGLATGGNKARKLEFLFADAQAQGADCVITCGAIQSNHVRQTAAGAALLGMRCHVLLENRTRSTDPDYLNSGNVLLDELLGAAVSVIPEGADIGQAMHDFAGELRDSGRRPYVIPGGGSNPVGALGYVNCAYELINQFTNCGIEFDALVHATGSSGTQAGLIAGFAIAGCDLPILGIGVRAPREKQENMVYELANATCSHVGNPGAVRREDVVANCDYVGAGYGVPTDGMLEALRLLATHEGILLDPVYSGKGMAGLIDLVRRGEFANARNIVFLHTGGSSALFGYRDCLSASV